MIQWMGVKLQYTVWTALEYEVCKYRLFSNKLITS